MEKIKDEVMTKEGLQFILLFCMMSIKECIKNNHLYNAGLYMDVMRDTLNELIKLR